MVPIVPAAHFIAIMVTVAVMVPGPHHGLRFAMVTLASNRAVVSASLVRRRLQPSFRSHVFLVSSKADLR